MDDAFALSGLGPVQLQWQNMVVGKRRCARFELGADVVELLLEDSTNHSLTSWVKLTLGAGEVWLAVDNWNAFASIQRVLGDVELVDLPTDLVPAVLESAFAAELSSLAAGLGDSLTFSQAGAEPPEDCLRSGQ